jgi:hypothetical protein
VLILGIVYAGQARPRALGLWGAGLAGAHIVVSLALLRPAYYAKFFGEAKMNLTGELSMLFGVLGAGCLAVLVAWSVPRNREDGEARPCSACLATGMLALAACHLFVMGIRAWLAPGGWPGRMPPISLVGFAAAVAALGVRVLRTAAEEGSGP